MERLGAELADPARSVRALQRGQIDHGEGQFQTFYFRGFLNTPGGQTCGTFFDANLIHRMRLDLVGASGSSV